MSTPSATSAAALLGGKVEAMLPHAGTPAETAVPKEWREKIIHGSMTVGDTALMASDAPPGQYSAPQGFSVALQGQGPRRRRSASSRGWQGLAELGRGRHADRPLRLPLDDQLHRRQLNGAGGRAQRKKMLAPGTHGPKRLVVILRTDS